MRSIFLSASVPVQGRGDYYQTADPLLIQSAIRALITTAIQDWKIVWGGHPSITPMICQICRELKIDCSNSLVLCESKFFENQFPYDHKCSSNVNLVEAVPGDRDASLLQMRRKMLSDKDLIVAVFIGGMEGVEIEHSLYKRFHPQGKVILVPATGGAASQLAEWMGIFTTAGLQDVDFVGLFQKELPKLSL
jgi:hypothetical protein